MPFLADLDEATAAAVWQAGTIRALKDGTHLVTELEAGDEVFLLLDGQIDITIGTGGHAPPHHVTTLQAGASIGEVAAFTGELRSATATARGPVSVLVFGRDAFHDLCRRYPRIAVGLARVLAARQQETDRAIAALLAPRPDGEAPAARPIGRHGWLRRAWVELVQSRRRELPFLMLSSFVLALLAARLFVFAAVQLGAHLLPILRTLYLGGLGLTALAALLGLLFFRPRLRRAVCIAYGAGLALAANELSVFVAFDVFFLDMTTRDPRLEFDVALLYRRSESIYAIILLLALALQATYLHRFYRRLAFDAAVHVRGLWRRLTRRA
ncbi:MAG TPA: cyclic nucleotide-binding domain-containing protein [Polyangia bacterium]